MKQNGNFRSSSLFYDYYNIYNMVWSYIYDSQQLINSNKFLSSCQSVYISSDMWSSAEGSIPGAGHLFRYVTNQPPKANSAVHPSGVGKWVPASAGKAKAGMVHSVSGWTRGVQVKLRSLENVCHTRVLRGVFTTRRYTNPCLPLPLT